MSDTLVQLADILPPILPAPSAASYWWIPLVALFALGICFWLIKHYRRNSVQRTLEQLKRGQLTPRQAAHTLAHLRPSSELDQLRFQRSEPTMQQLQQLVESESSHG